MRYDPFLELYYLQSGEGMMMDSPDRMALLHFIAETVRSGSDVKLDQSGQLEMRLTGIVDQVLRGLADLFDIENKPSSKISRDAVPKVWNLVSKVAEELGSANAETKRDFEVVKTCLARSTFGYSQNFPWTELLLGASDPSTITLTSFAQSNRSLIKDIAEIESPSRANEVEPSIQRNCADLFISFIQHAIKEGKWGHYHIEYELLVYAELLMANYHSLIMDPHFSGKELNQKLVELYESTVKAMERFLGFSDDLFLKIGALDFASRGAVDEAARHIEVARKYAEQESAVLFSEILEGSILKDTKSIKEAISRLNALPHQTQNMACIRVELISALRLKALSDIQLDPQNLNSIWSKSIFLELLKYRVKLTQDDAGYHHQRVAKHDNVLQSNLKDRENSVAFSEKLLKELSAVTNNESAQKNLEGACKTHEKLILDLKEAKRNLEEFRTRLQEKNIDQKVLKHSATEGLSDSSRMVMDHLKEKIPRDCSEAEIDRQITEFRKAYHFLRKRAEDLEKVLHDPMADMFD